LAARLVVGGVWLVAGALKVAKPSESIHAVEAYQLVSSSAAQWIGVAMPAIELVVGLALVLGVLVRGAAVVSALLLVAYIAAIASVWARGLTIDCGCFGGGGTDPNAASAYPWEIARDAGLLLFSAFLVWRRRTALALDSLLFPHRPTPLEGD
jgi:uncharacterized membrane protein YphA (DoxX/SURF4 family)